MTYDSVNLEAYLIQKRKLVDHALEQCFSEHPVSSFDKVDITDPMKYSLFAGGKRLRPILCLAGCAAVGGSEANVLPVACALEFIHTYSLIHDDLPVMDDDDLRRGKATNHKVFGEAMALLAGDGLLTEAFHIMANAAPLNKTAPELLLKVIGLIAQNSGYRGMIGGQLADIQSEGKTADLCLVEFIHSHKTGALIQIAVASGALLGGGDEAQIASVSAYGSKIGLAFQISDDILDIEGDSDAMGKTAGADINKEKVTYPSVVGLAQSKKIQSELVEAAIASLHNFGDGADPLRLIAQYIVERKK